MKKNLLVFLVLTLFPGSCLLAQDFYELTHIPTIRIAFRDKNWKHLLDSLIFAGDGNGRILGDVTIDGQVIPGAGIRYKGFSSVDTTKTKNPFNIDLQYSRDNRNFQGNTTLKLSNVVDDPSFIREALSYEIARKYMPAPVANFAEVYINDTLIGLYTNVESVGKKFIEKYFPSKDNSFFKGSPQHLQYPFGENANLNYSHGTDTAGYMPYYEAESASGWKDLVDFIHTLCKQPDSIGFVLNTDRALWMHAFNFTLLNLDSYIGYSQNYYVYRDDNGRFNTIPWDLNMSFGSFRNSDGSYHYNGLTIDETEHLDPLEHLNFCVSPRPLMTQLFSKDTYRKKFFAHMRTLVNENFRNGDYLSRGQVMQQIIDSAVRRDPNKFYSYSDFHDNLTVTVGGTGNMIEFPGIKELVEARVAYLDSYPGFAGTPVITEVKHTPASPAKGELVWIMAKASGAGKVVLSYRGKSHDVFLESEMYDDGNHNDGVAGDSIYGTGIIANGATLQYYIWAENDSAGIFSPERAEFVYDSIQPLIGRGEVVINEIEALNTTDPDQDGDYDSWIELLNNTRESLNLKGLALSDDPAELSKWQLPDTIVKPGNYLILWADQDISQSGLHTSFSLPGVGGKLLLSNPARNFIDSLVFGQQVAGKSLGRYPNGYGSFVFMPPSISAYNRYGTLQGKDLLLYPNPANSRIHIEMQAPEDPCTIQIFDAWGRAIRSESLSGSGETSTVLVKDYNVSDLAAGAYYLKVISRSEVITRKFIIY